MLLQMVVAFLLLFVGVRGILRHKSGPYRGMLILMSALVVIGLALVVDALRPR